MSRQSHFFEGVFIGSLLGFIFGVLFAPTSGEETRRRLREFKDENEELIVGTKNKTENMIEKTLKKEKTSI